MRIFRRNIQVISSGRNMSSMINFFPSEDPRVDKYFLAKSPIAPLSILVAYIIFVFKLGPAFMKNRKAFDLKGAIFLYNAAQIVANVWGFKMSIKIWHVINPWCGPVDSSLSPTAMQAVEIVHYYYLLKMADLTETIFFVLRKKYNQVSTLHVYHHVTMLLGTWIFLRYYPGGQIIYVAAINTFTHAAMYFYYLLTICDAKYKGSVWWKKHLTQLQIVQQAFIVSMMLSSLFDKSCSYPKPICCFTAVNCTFIMSMFLNFYIKSYVLKKRLNY